MSWSGYTCQFFKNFTIIQVVPLFIRFSDSKSLGSYRWLVWAIAPITDDNGENTAFQKLQVLPASGDEK